MMKKIQDIYKSIKVDIKKRLKEFEELYIKANEEEIFVELAFCILTPQSKAKNAWKAISNLRDTGLLFNGKAEEIADELNIVRFKNNKARYLVLLRELMTKENKIQAKSILKEAGNIKEQREWLVENVKGIGYKEASHFLRNIGFGQELAILDRHILKNLVNFEVITEIPKTINKKNYLEIEQKMKKISKELDISMAELDLVLWYKEAGEIFK